MYTHSYYHIQLIPVVALGLASIIQAVVGPASGLPRVWKAALFVIILITIGYQSWVARSVLVAQDYSHAPLPGNQLVKPFPQTLKLSA